MRLWRFISTMIEGDNSGFDVDKDEEGGRVEACGAVANYNTSSLTGLRNWFEVITNRFGD